MTHPVKSPKKLIEVALPLDIINVACSREKSIRHGHPSTLHLWWARRPLAAARAVIFSQMVNDPSWKWEMEHPGQIPPSHLKASWAASRKRLFKIIEDLVLWENTTNEVVLERARVEIRKSWREVCELNKEHPQAAELFNLEKLPAFHDPFAGGGSIPLEAQRLGLEAYASDLNPVAVLINKAMIEIPPKFAGRPPVGPISKGDKQTSVKADWPGATGLAEDVRRYGAWMREEAFKRIGHLYPLVDITTGLPFRPEFVEGERGSTGSLRTADKTTVIAWLWARTVKSPNPAFSHVDVPLVSTFILSSKAGKEAYVQPVIEGDSYRFEVKTGKSPESARGGTTAGKRAGFLCLMSNTPMDYKYIRAEGSAGRMGQKLMAIVAEGSRNRVYLTPTSEMELIAQQAQPEWRPETKLHGKCRVNVSNYGLDCFGDLFTPRQLVALTTFSDLVQEVREKVKHDALADWNPSPQRGEVGRGESWQPTPVPVHLLQAARELRKTMTDAEQMLWQSLRGKQLNHFKFRKQHPIDRYVLDFYCSSKKLAIELDGGQHNTEDIRTKDAERTSHIEKRGIRVLRFWNHDIFKNFDGVMTEIWNALHENPHPGPPPLGEGDVPLAAGGTGATAYCEAVSVYLAFLVGQVANHSSNICGWNHPNTQMRSVFSRQAIPMTWDFAEVNIFSVSSGSYANLFERLIKGMGALNLHGLGHTIQSEAQNQSLSVDKIISTDPPYYDNIGYADLSDFFYVWLRRSLRSVYPSLFSTMAVPKAEELVATPYRHGSKEKAESFFLNGMTEAMHQLSEQAHPAFPTTIYYAFKQSETNETGTGNTGWETFLDAVLRAGFALTGTWPMRTEREGRTVGLGSNALASSIILVCRKRSLDAPTVSRREYIRELNAILPEALDEMTKGSGDDASPVAPVDLSQSIIGPGMAVFSKYAAVLEADGSAMSIHTALQLINRFLAEDDFDPDTQFCLHWFEQNGWSAGRFGDADTLSRAKGTSVDGVANAGVVESGGGNVRLLKWSEYPTDWDPTTDTRNPIWETLHHLIRSLKQDGETVAGRLLSDVKSQGESVRQLAYRLYTLCERQGWAEDARAYNELITSWSGIESASVEAPGKLTQIGLV
jgi:adenine-specific DNA methylase